MRDSKNGISSVREERGLNMKSVKVENLKVGQIVLVGDLDGDNFEVAEVREVAVHFKNWDNIDMKKGTLLKKEDGRIDIQKNKGGIISVLNSAEMIKVNKMKNKILIVKELSK